MILRLLLFLIILFNSSCAKKYYRILQAQDNGALGYICPYIDSLSYECQLAYFDNIESILYYDDLVFEVPSNLEATLIGIHKYTDMENKRRTVPHFSFIEKE